MADASYTRDELLRAGEYLPERGPVCHECGMHIPQFADMTDADERRVRHLISQGRSIMAMQELRAATGCPLSWAKIWVLHSGKPHAFGTVPCPFCGEPLRTSLAKQCRFCRRDWHDPENVRFFGDA